MNEDDSLTSLILNQPAIKQELKKYARSHGFDFADLDKLNNVYNSYYKGKRLKQTTLFHLACNTSKPLIVQQLVEEGWDVNFPHPTIPSPLYSCLENGNISNANRLIKLGADYKSYDAGCGFTPMAAALAIGNNRREKSCLSAVKLLLDVGLYVNEPINEDQQQRPLHLAIRNNLPTVVSCLIQNGADINVQDSTGLTPLHVAVFQKQFDIIRLLLLHGPDLYKRNLNGETPFIVALKEDLKPIIKLFVQNGYDMNLNCDKLDAAPLHTAVRILDTELVTFLIDMGADVNLATENGLTPLHVLTDKNLVLSSLIEKKMSQKRREIAELLISSGADVEKANAFHISPLVSAIKWGLVDLAKELVNLGANVNDRSEHIYLFFDVVSLNRDVIISFLDHGVDFNAHNLEGFTPYHSAILNRIDLRFIKSFVQHGCPYDQEKLTWEEVMKRSNNRTRIFFQSEMLYFKGIEENDLKGVKKAVDCGAVVGSCSEGMKYPLHYLSLHGHRDVLKYLLENQAPPNILNDDGESALHIAAGKGHYAICLALLQFGAIYNLSSKKSFLTPKDMANQGNHKQIVNLFKRVKHMFHLATVNDEQVITVLKDKFNSNKKEYLAFVKAVTKNGDNLLETALKKNNMKIANDIMELQLQCTFYEQG